MAALLELDNVSKQYGGGLLGGEAVTALESTSLSIADDEPSVTVIAGESGSGKTTLANLLLGMTEPTTGLIRYRGKDLQAMTAAEHLVFRREVQVIFQDPFESYNPFHKVDRVLRMPLRKFKLVGSDDESRDRIRGALEMVGLRAEETLGRYPHELSGGQRQRIMVARALALRPRIIVADEPVSMVDASLRATILESLLRLNRELRISVIYITHDLTTAYQVGDRAIILYRGAIAELGDVEPVIKKPLHPYTRLLVESIPIADPERRWSEERVVTASEDDPVDAAAGCKFVARCPFAMSICSEREPPIYRADAARGVACFLHREHPTVTAAALFAREKAPGRPLDPAAAPWAGNE